MINRKLDHYLEFFYKEHSKALLITGARQTGKTFSIRHFGRTNFESFVEINFLEEPEAVALFANARNSTDILFRLSTYTSVHLIKGRTLVFFDEVQECPEIVTAIKFLVEEGSFRYILSGSLLGITLKDIRSVPVGYMDVKEMYPLDLEEFVQAIGVSDNVMGGLRECFDSKVAVDEYVHKKMMDLFRLYLIVGGMPAAVQRYIDTNNMQAVAEEQESIIRLYKMDIGKYDNAHKLYIEEIFNLIPPELNSKNKRFILKNLNENLKFSRYENSFLWLKDAGVALPVYNVEEPKSPLLLAKSRNLFKLFQNDIGLLACQYAGGIQLKILKGDESINCGSVYENAIAQELKAHGFDLYYYNSKRYGELDFVIESGGEVIPIEVKSGKDYSRHKALNNILSIPDYDINEAYVITTDNLSSDGKVTYMPAYMSMFIKPKASSIGNYAIDISGLTI